MPNNNIDNEFWTFILIIAIPLIFVLLVGLIFRLSEFSRELKYLNCEINRTYGSERRYWIRKKRRLWLSLIPFVKY